MKHTITICLLLLTGIVSLGQSYDSAILYRFATPSYQEAMDHFIAEATADPSDTGEESRSSVLERRKLWQGSRISNDVAIGADMFAPMSTALTSYMTYYTDYCPSEGITGNWKCMGPFNDFYGSTEQNGRVDAIWVHPTDTGHILLGSNGGGLWKTNNGGISWRCITDGAMGTSSSVLGMAGVQCIAVNPSDTNMIYIAQGGREQSKKSNNYGLGLVYTTNGGTSWHSDATFNSLVSASAIPSITKIAYMPGTQKLFAISETKVLYKPSPTDPWEDITPSAFSPDSRWCFDMDFTHSPAGRLVVSFSSLGNTSYLCTYTPSSDTWSYMPIVLTGGYTQPDYKYGAVRISLSSSDIAYMQFRALDASSDHASLLIKSPITTYSQDEVNSNLTDHLPGASMYQLTDFMVSPANSEIVYASNYSGSNDCIYKSIDGGTNFAVADIIGHADGNCLFIHSATNTDDGENDVVYVGNDGGIRKKRYGTLYFAGITGTGLCITQFFGFGNTEADDGIMMGGAQDVGTWAYRKTETLQWSRVAGGDGYTAKYAKSGIKKAFGETYGGTLHSMFGKEFTTTGVSSFYVPTPADIPVSNINRPQYFNPQNTAHVGYSHIWKKDYNSVSGDWDFGSWENAFDKDPIDIDEDHAFEKIVVDFSIDEQNTNNVYISYRDPTGIGKSPANDTFGKLYYSIDATSTFPLPTWTNITPAICTTNGINTIMVDPNNPARIWVGFGNINGDLSAVSPEYMENRVKYSDDYGAHWHDASKGLSALPVNKLLYRKGTDDELYAGTDAGVFRWNKVAAQWECFNSGLPPCTVMDMEFNYCANKLRVATFGRGIWETPLPIIHPDDKKPITISTNTTWNSEMWLESDIIIKPGARLFLNGAIIHMPANAHIMVSPNARLVVNNSTITNSCEGCLWGGIQAWGNSYMPQTPANQGHVSIYNGSIIEHAIVGVCNYNPADEYTTGGVIQGNRSIFRNNALSASFKPFENISGSPLFVPIPDISNFITCSFLVDDDYKGFSRSPVLSPVSHVRLEGIKGVRFLGCSFANRCALYRGKGDGIYAVNSGFSAYEICPTLGLPCVSTPVPCSFRGLMNGIMVKGVGINSDPVVSIDHADFDSVSVGVNISLHRGVSVTNSNFTVGTGFLSPFVPPSGAPLGCGRNVGIMTQNTLVFRVEANSFAGVSNSYGFSPWYNIGVLTANAGNFTNRIYRNNFEDLSYGLLGIGDNSPHYPALPGFGVQVSCNHFTNNTNDIQSAGIYDFEGIGRVQMGPLGADAGNTFSSSVKNVVNSNPTHSMAYWRYATSVSTSGGVLLYNSPTEETCNSTIPSSGGGLPSGIIAPNTALDVSVLNDYKSTFYTARNSYIAAEEDLKSLIDRGASQELLVYIDTSTNRDALYDTLMAISPYLSVNALLTTVVNAQQGEYTDIINVLAGNPDVIKDYTLLSAVASHMNMDTTDFNMLWDTAKTITARSLDENNIRIAKTESHEMARLVVLALKSPIDTNISVTDTTYAGLCMDTTSMYYMVDTNAFYWPLDSVDVWLSNINELPAQYERMGLKAHQKDYDGALSIFNSIDTSNFTTAEREEYNTYYILGSVQLTAALDGRSVFQLKDEELNMLDSALILIDTTASMYTGQRYFTTNSAMAAIWNIPIDIGLMAPCVFAYPESKSGNNVIDIRKYAIDNVQISAKNSVKVYPNPSDGLVTFEYNIPNINTTSGCELTVANIMGVKVMNKHIGNKVGKISWDASQLPSGVYLYRFASENNIVGNGKLTIVR